MSIWARLKSLGGGRQIPTLTAAASLSLPPEHLTFYLSGTATVTALDAYSPVLEARRVTFIGLSGTTTFTNTDGATAKGTLDLGGSNRAVAATDVLTVMQRGDGSWLNIGGLIDN